MTVTIEDLLEGAALPTTAPERTGFDVGVGLRRLAAEPVAPADDVARATAASQRLSVVCRWIINAPDAGAQVDRLADRADEERQEVAPVDGELVFACLLFLAGHPESAKFWWQLAAGAGDRVAAYCLHQHHLALGEDREARHWRHQLAEALAEDRGTEVVDDVFLDSMGLVAQWVRRNGSKAHPPTGDLEMEVDRLADEDEQTCGIVHLPDHRLARRMIREFTRP
ncbi:hypothetical protein [Streptomyces sp. NBC_01497]|uniref:hypothetical protein n=1 Tax=Streptomyces sp. NBC_01497 TaxID=2903885 RepID=UPI002E353E36|nr:hypothetical protein [Streptomyces sp. NBC_01497]